MDLESLRRDLVSPKKIEEIIMQVTREFLIPRFMALGMNATGEWVDSLHAKENVLRGRRYTEQLEYGRRPGTYPPIKPIIRWVEAKLGLRGKQAESAAWAIRHTIKEEGTTWYKKGGSDLMEVLEEPETIRYFNEQVGRHIVSVVKTYVSQEILKQLKSNDS